MLRGLRSALRVLRVLLACVVLGVTAAPPAHASTVDVVAWVAEGNAATHRAAPPRAVRGARVATVVARRAPSALATSPRALPRTSPRPPAGARAVVVDDRLFLRHEALLR